MPVKQGRKRGTGPRVPRAPPSTRGDIPQRQKVDYQTSSTVPPRRTGVLTIRQLAPLQQLSASNSAANTTVVTFALNGINGAGTLSSLFDQYQINAIRATVRANNTAIQLVDPTVTALVPLYWVIDYNDAVPLASTTNALEYDNCLILTPGEHATRTFCPKYSLLARSSAGNDYINRTGDWLATVSDDILHYGFKFYIPQTNALQAQLQTWTLELEYYLTFTQVS